MAYSILFKKTKEGSSVIDTLDKWGIVCKEFPFKLYGEAKDLYSNSWLDQDGDEQYVPDQIRIKAYEIDVEFAYKGAYKSGNSVIKSFLDYLTGRDGSGANLLVYDTYTGIGRKDVHYLDIDNDLFYRMKGNEEVITFFVKFRVNNPTEDITLTK